MDALRVREPEAGCDLAPDRVEMATVAERANDHALVRQSFADSESSFVVESLVVIGVDAAGRIATYVAFATDAEHRGRGAPRRAPRRSSGLVRPYRSEIATSSSRS